MLSPLISNPSVLFLTIIHTYSAFVHESLSDFTADYKQLLTSNLITIHLLLMSLISMNNEHITIIVKGFIF